MTIKGLFYESLERFYENQVDNVPKKEGTESHQRNSGGNSLLEDCLVTYTSLKWHQYRSSTYPCGLNYISWRYWLITLSAKNRYLHYLTLGVIVLSRYILARRGMRNNGVHTLVKFGKYISQLKIENQFCEKHCYMIDCAASGSYYLNENKNYTSILYVH